MEHDEQQLMVGNSPLPPISHASALIVSPSPKLPRSSAFRA